jgi:hypothetical protein
MGVRQAATGLIFALHVLIAMTSVHPATVRKKPWRRRDSFPCSWLILSSVMLHMSFVGSVHGASLDWDPVVVLSKTKEAVLFMVFEAWCDPPPKQPPDTRPLGSHTCHDEWVYDHLHHVLHQAHYAKEYTFDEATSLSNYLALTRWQLNVVHPDDKLTANTVEPIQCNVTCSANKEGPDFEILFDTGATHSFINDLNDFISDLKVETKSVGGFLGTDAPVMGSGTVQWHLQGDDGQKQTLTTEVYYVPSGQRQLFCPQHHFQSWERSTQATSPGSFTVQATKCIYVDNLGWKMQWSMLALPVLRATCCSQCEASPLVLDPTNTNLTSPQKELKLWHDRLGHCGFGWVQRLM